MRAQVLPDAATVESLLAAAVAAPSIHNTQPWRFRLDRDSQVLEVHSEPARTLPLADPMHRAQYLSVGAALFNLRLAAVHRGWRPEVRLLPDPHVPGLLAAVRLTGPLTADDQPCDPGLHEAIARRHTSRMPFTGRPVPEPIVAEMAAAARAGGARLHVPDIAGTRRLLRLTAAAEARHHAHPGRTAETLAWINPQEQAPPTAYPSPPSAPGRGRADADAGLHRRAARSPPARPVVRTPRPTGPAVDVPRPAGGLAASRPGPAVRPPHGDRPRPAHLTPAPGHGMARPADGDGSPATQAVPSARTDPLRVRPGGRRTPRGPGIVAEAASSARNPGDPRTANSGRVRGVRW